MIFWSNLKSKIKNIISRSEFDALKSKVDNNTTLINQNKNNIGLKANTTDLNRYIKKQNTENLVFENTANTIIKAHTTNITSLTGDIELRVPDNKSVNLGNRKITGLANPTSNDNAANKQYVDTAISNIPSVDLTPYVKKTNTANTIITAPIVNITANGGNIELRPRDNIDCGNKKIVNVANPTNAQDVATKNYVDNKPGLSIRSISRSISSFRTTTITSNQYLITFTVDTRGINQILGIIFNTVTNLNFVPIKYFINTSNGTCVVLSERNYFDLQTPTSVTIKYL